MAGLMLPGMDYRELVSVTTTGAVLVQTVLGLEARCVKCMSMIAWSGSFWYCSKTTCMHKIIDVGRDARNSVMNLDASILVMTEWTAKWLNVSPLDVRVVVTR